MKKSKCVLLITLPLLLASCQGGNSSEIKKAFIVDNAPYYTDVVMGNNVVTEKVADLTYAYWNTEPYIIYMALDQALNTLLENVEVTKNGDVATYECDDDLTFVVDAEANTILAHNYGELNLFSKKYDSPLGVIDEEHTTSYVRDGGSTYSEEEDVLFDLNDYNMDIISFENEIYIPYTIVNYMTFNFALWSSVNFNGEAFYFVDLLSGSFNLYGARNQYAQNYYNTSLYKSKTRPEYYAKHNYYSLLFLLDHYYGFLDDRFVPWENYLETNHKSLVKKLLSKNDNDYEAGIEQLMEEIIGDGHTNAGGASSLFGTGSYQMKWYSSERSEKLSSDRMDCYQRRNNAGIDANTVRFAGNTAILSFDGFYHQSVTFTPDNIANYKNADTFALFYCALQAIDEQGDIENVVWDITCNGGGDTNALFPLTGFMSETVESGMYNPLTKQSAHLTYKVDNDLDGDFDDLDSYKGKYNFFVLQSSYSFSCANLFPMMCKDNGYATIIGETSGGGSCVVYYTATPDGRPFRMSGFMRIGHKDAPINYEDYGITPDYNLTRDHFYDDSYINTFINELSA